MYTLLVGNDKYIHTTKRERLFQGVKFHSNVRILVRKDFGNFAIENCRVAMMYETPITHEIGVLFLEPSEELYKDSYVEYVIPDNTLITMEHGDVMIDLMITGEIDGSEQILDMATDGVISIKAYDKDWDDTIGDEQMSEANQTILEIQEIRRQQEAVLEELREMNLITDLVIDEDGRMHLAKGEYGIGNGVNVVVSDVNEKELDGNLNGILELDKINLRR